MNLILSALGRLCRGKIQSNRNIRKRLEERRGAAPPSFVLALLLTVIINNPVAAQSQQTTPVTINLCVQERLRRVSACWTNATILTNHNADNTDQP